MMDETLYTYLMMGYTHTIMGYTYLIMGCTHTIMGYTYLMKGYTHTIRGYTYLMMGYDASAGFLKQSLVIPVRMHRSQIISDVVVPTKPDYPKG